MELGPCQFTQVLINRLYMYLARHEMIVKAPYECNTGKYCTRGGVERLIQHEAKPSAV